MIVTIRNKFNEGFTELKYQQMLADITKGLPANIEFRLAETPVFLDAKFKARLLEAGAEVCDFIKLPDFKKQTASSFLHVETPPDETDLPACIVMDFAISRNAQAQPIPKLIELQGFPSLFGFEIRHHEAFEKNFSIPTNYSPYLNNYHKETYLLFLSQIIKGNENKHTVLLELFPHEQKTKIDFYITNELLSIPIVCLSEIFVKQQALFYKRDGVDFKIERIYNRIVWDELVNQSPAIQEKGKLLLQPLNLEWVTHPNHFYRISKYLLPSLVSEFVPKTHFLSALKTIPTDLENYVLKPLFSYAGQGVLIDVHQADIARIQDPENWILQEKVEYAPVIHTPTGPAKAEIRLFYFLDKTTNQYIATLNLARISKGKMIGVSYNANASWVGGSIAYFESSD
jgi:hypothetical protein